MYIDRKWIFLMMGIFLISGIVGMSQQKLLALVLTIPGLLIAITFHEFAHAFAADKLGDDTPKRQGRLTLNPIRHLDPVGSVLLLFAGFGWGRPVEINPRNFNRNISMQKGEAIVSVAGPLMNILLAFVFTIIYFFVYKFAPQSFFVSTPGVVVMLLLQTTIFTNIGLGIFNLIPLPPLDGSKIFMSFLPYNARNWIMNHEQVFYIVFLVIWIFGLAGYIISPVIDAVSSGIFWLVSILFGFI